MHWESLACFRRQIEVDAGDTPQAALEVVAQRAERLRGTFYSFDQQGCSGGDPIHDHLRAERHVVIAAGDRYCWNHLPVDDEAHPWAESRLRTRKVPEDGVDGRKSEDRTESARLIARQEQWLLLPVVPEKSGWFERCDQLREPIHDCSLPGRRKVRRWSGPTARR